MTRPAGRPPECIGNLLVLLSDSSSEDFVINLEYSEGERPEGCLRTRYYYYEWQVIIIYSPELQRRPEGLPSL